jgi:hypothetical protein
MKSIRTKQEQFGKRKIVLARKIFNPLFLYGFWRRGLRWERQRRHLIAAMLGMPAKRLTHIRKGPMLCAYREGDLKKLTSSAVSAQRVS